MIKRAAIALSVLLLVAAGLVGWNRFERARFADCTLRAERLEAVSLLAQRPDGAQPDPAAPLGCDPERLVAHAIRYYKLADQQTVSSFYRQAAERDGWRVTEPRMPSDHGSENGLCMKKDIDGITGYATLLFPEPGTLELHLSESVDLGAGCSRSG
jgi:hypothetical protein